MKNERALRALLWAVAVGLFVVFVYSAQYWTEGKAAGVASVGIMAAGASLLVGGLLGFLFGIPRTLQEERPGPRVASGGPSSQRANGNELPLYRANTNLEQISDWLTKILVGVGLTQIGAIPERIGQLAGYLARGLGGSESSSVFAVAVVVYYVGCGFLLGYLWTRLFLAGALLRADFAAEIERLRNDSDQGKADAFALNLVQGHLHRAADLRPASTDEEKALKEAIKRASRSVKAQIYYQASEFRSARWERPTDKPKMERTIPIFEALIESDTEDRYYQNHGQLGFALKDRPVPDWARAEAELTKAIGMRGSWEENGWLLYEFNRAICRIMLDGAYRERRPSSPSDKARILADLQAAAQTELASVIQNDETIQGWLALNGTKLDEIARRTAGLPPEPPLDTRSR